MGGEFHPGDDYARNDIISFDGSSYIARKDNPGRPPSAGWLQLAARGRSGKTGPQGPAGERGERGAPGASMVADAAW